jgi:hypothetical protein
MKQNKDSAMEQVIEKLFIESGYEKKSQGIDLYSKGDHSFFFTLSISESSFRELRSKDAIRSNESYRVILDQFNQNVNSGEQASLEKNTSLIILVNCTNINAISMLQSQILLLEEDEYFFKKYVILYTDSSISNLSADPLIPALRARVNDIDKFNQFANEGYHEGLEEYLVAMQLFIKLPFLPLEHGVENFIPLSEKILAELDTEVRLYQTLLETCAEFMQIDFTVSENEDHITQLLSRLPND